MEILGADFLDWSCDGSDVNEAFKLDEVADLNLPSDLPTTSGQHTGNKRMFAAPMTDAEVQNIIADGVHAFADDIKTCWHRVSKCNEKRPYLEHIISTLVQM